MSTFANTTIRQSTYLRIPMHSEFRQIKDPAADVGSNISAASDLHDLQAHELVALFERLDLMKSLECVEMQASLGFHQGQYHFQNRVYAVGRGMTARWKFFRRSFVI